MKKIIFFLIWLLPIIVFSQKNFEGIITYEGYATPNDQTFHFTIYYGRDKIKVVARSKSSSDKFDKDKKNTVNILYDLEKGIGFSIDSLEKNIEVDSLNFPSPADPELDFIPTDSLKIIGNHLCRMFIARSVNKDSLAIMSKGTVSIWFAENIKYIVPKPYRNKRSLQTTPEGNYIWLEFILIAELPSPFDSRKRPKDTVLLQAKLVEERDISDSIFNLPADFSFTYNDNNSFTEEVETKKEQPQKPPLQSSNSLKSPAQKPIKQKSGNN